MSHPRYRKPDNKGMRKKPYVPPVFKGFLDPYLSPHDLAAQKEMSFTPENGFEILQKFVEEGFAVKFSFDAANDCFQTTMTPKSPEHAFAGMYLVGRGSDALKALKQLAYKHITILHGYWSEDMIKQTREDYE